MLRSIFVLGLMLIGLRYAFKGPFYVLLCYLWLAYFRPEQWLWYNFTANLNLSFLVGVAVVVAALFSGQRWRLGLGPVLILLFLVQSLLSTTLSPAFDTAWKYWQEFARTIALSYMITVLVTSEDRVRLTLQVMAFSLAFEGAKEGFVQFVLNPTTPNANPMPMFGDNNGVGVGMLMLVPLLAMLAGSARDKRERYLEWFLGLGVFLRALGTYSRRVRGRERPAGALRGALPAPRRHRDRGGRDGHRCRAGVARSLLAPHLHHPDQHREPGRDGRVGGRPAVLLAGRPRHGRQPAVRRRRPQRL